MAESHNTLHAQSGPPPLSPEQFMVWCEANYICRTPGCPNAPIRGYVECGHCIYGAHRANETIVRKKRRIEKAMAATPAAPHRQGEKG